MASGPGIAKAQPEICSWHLTPPLAGSARRSVPCSLSPNCQRRGAGVNGASRLLAGYRSRRSSGNRSPLHGLSQVRRVPGANEKQPPGRLLLECLKHREADVLRFLSDTAIPPTSNQAERDLRPSKTQQKISGRRRSEKTTRDRYAIRGYASTAAKHGTAVFTAIRDALAGNPWMPPIPASA
jgi:hypothetical protein